MSRANSGQAFAESDLILGVDDSGLRNALKKDEQLVSRSSAKMQGSMNKLSTSTASTGQVFSAFGAQVSALGGVVGNVGGKIASLGGAFAGLGKAILGPAGIILAATAALGAIIAKIISAKEEAKRAAEELRGFTKEIGEFAKTRFKTADQAIESLSDRLAVLKASAPRDVISTAGELALTQLDRQGVKIIESTLEARKKILEVEKKLKSLRTDDENRKALETTKRRLSEVIDANNEALSLIQKIEIEQKKKIQRQLETFDKQQRDKRILAERLAAEKIASERLKINQTISAKFAASPAGRIIGGLIDIKRQREEKTILEKLLSKISPFLGTDTATALRTKLGLSPTVAQESIAKHESLKQRSLSAIRASQFTDLISASSQLGTQKPATQLAKIAASNEKRNDILESIKRFLIPFATDGAQ